MTQPTERDKELVRKLLNNSLSPENREKLNRLGFVQKALYTQWEETSDIYTDASKEERILNNIMHKIKEEPSSRLRRTFNKYALVASVALLLICGTLSILLFTQKPTSEVWYVLNSGRQSMDSVQLADGTFVILNAGSKLTYPKNFIGERREVILSGQAFFRVHPNKKSSFVVKTKNMDITALGTSFEVFSYDTDTNVETTLLNGKIKVEPKDDKEAIKGEYILSPNEKLSCNQGKVRIEHVDANTYSAWRTGGRLVFKNETLAMILPRLEKWYGQKIECPSKIADHYRFTFTLRNEPLDLILNIMSHSAPITYNLKSNDYYVLKELR
ncbi:FecR family protein [Bacteroides sp.]